MFPGWCWCRARLYKTWHRTQQSCLLLSHPSCPATLCCCLQSSPGTRLCSFMAGSPQTPQGSCSQGQHGQQDSGWETSPRSHLAADLGALELHWMEEEHGNGSCCTKLCSARAAWPKGCSRRAGSAKWREGAPAGHVSQPRRRRQSVKCLCDKKKESPRPRAELGSRLVICNQNLRFH